MNGDGTANSGSPAGVGSIRLSATAPGPSARAGDEPRAMPRSAPASAAPTVMRPLMGAGWYPRRRRRSKDDLPRTFPLLLARRAHRVASR
ncbi:hypothetical protein BE11_24555 [Sorangium cellulosum]|nr:hypothetical protein BE11_24555 [Sorangium cellulosum]